MSQSYTVDDIARLLQISKLTVYDLIKKGDIPAYRVGRQMRVDVLDLERFKSRGKEVKLASEEVNETPADPIVISGQDDSLDILARSLETLDHASRPLRSYVGSLDGLIGMYQGNIAIASTHLFDGNTNTYNLPYIQKILVSRAFIVVKFLQRKTGFYVAKGNPNNIYDWIDLANPSIRLANREAGAGARILLDEQLRFNHISRTSIVGYDDEQTSHLAVASAVASGRADVGVGIKQTAHMMDIDFIPLQTEDYDLVILNTAENANLITHVLGTLKSDNFKEELHALGHTTSRIGEIIWEQ